MMKYTIVIILFFILSCGTNNKKVAKADNNDVPIKIIDLVNINDTIEKKKVKGILKIFFKLNDSTKLNPSDKLKINTALSIISYDKTINDSLREVVRKNLIINPLKLNDTIRIPFAIQPHFKGKGNFKVYISDRYYLNSYTNDDELRMISYENFFEKDIFIK